MHLLSFIRSHLLLVIALVAILGLGAFFAAGAMKEARGWDPDRPVIIKPWMTNRFIAHSWDIPRDVMAEEVNLPRSDGRMTLKALAEQRGVEVETLMTEVQAAIIAYKARQP